MTNSYKLLQLALAVFGLVALLMYPLSIVWPSRWAWHADVPALLLVAVVLAALVRAADLNRRLS